MVQVNYSDIIIATAAAFLLGLLYYVLLSNQVKKSRSLTGKIDVKHKTFTIVGMIFDFIRTFVVGLFIAYAVSFLNLLYINQAMLLAIWLWIAFPVVLFVGLVIHDKFPVRLAVIHSIDWLIKLLVITSILTLWR